MAVDQVDQTVVAQAPSDVAVTPTVRTDGRPTSIGPGVSELTRRIVVLLFGLVQILIGARIVLLLLDAREANVLVSAILNMSQVFVAPFEGMLRTDSLHASGAALDITAVVAFAGWTVLELIAIWAVGIFRREPTTRIA